MRFNPMLLIVAWCKNAGGSRARYRTRTGCYEQEEMSFQHGSSNEDAFVAIPLARFRIAMVEAKHIFGKGEFLGKDIICI